nr:FAD-dependent oxidoreductase [Angustibacter aerolatus]
MSRDAEQFDVVVVGGGAAGLSAAVALSRARRRVLVVDGGQPRNAPAAGVHNFLTREGVSPREPRGARPRRGHPLRRRGGARRRHRCGAGCPTTVLARRLPSPPTAAHP